MRTHYNAHTIVKQSNGKYTVENFQNGVEYSRLVDAMNAIDDKLADNFTKRYVR